MGGKLSARNSSGGSNRTSSPGSMVSSHPRASVTPRGSTRPRLDFLEDDEPEIIRRQWKTLKSGDAQSMGVRIFLRIFELEPKTQEAFKSLRGMESDELVSNVLFRSHSMRFMQAVEGTVVNLEALEVIIVPNLRQLGRRHTDFSGFHPEYMKAFEQAMDETWKHELGSTEYNAKAQLAWQKIFQLITATVLSGYTEVRPNTAAATAPAAAATAAAAAPADDRVTDRVTKTQLTTSENTNTNNSVINNSCENRACGQLQIDRVSQADSSAIDAAQKNCTEFNASRGCPENGIDKNGLQLVT